MDLTTRRCAAVFLALTACTPGAQSQEAAQRRTPVNDDAYLTVDALRQAYAAAELTPLDMTLLFLQRIESIDRTGPALRAVLETNPDAAVAAQAATTLYRQGVPQPLSGIPVLLKGNIDTGDRMLTTAGSLAFDRPALQDATVAAKLRDAGAVLLGKTNLSEWAAFRGEHSVNGWSARGGRTLHPYVLDRDPGGSSTGSAVAVAAGLATVALGTETDASIVAPAMAMGLVGIKPTVGLVSRTGIVPISLVQDTVGPMARSVADAAAVLSVIAGSDPGDPATDEADMHAEDYRHFQDVRGMRIGIVRQASSSHDMERTIRILADSGAIIFDPVELPISGNVSMLQEPLLLAEFKHAIAGYLSTRTEQPLRTLDDLIAFNERESTRELSLFGQEVFLAANAAPPLTDPGYLLARSHASTVAGPAGIDAALATHQLDALVGTPDMVHVAAVAGYPVVTVPTHFSGELPSGALLFGTKWSEPTLISIAAAIENEAQAFQRPTFLPALPAATD